MKLLQVLFLYFIFNAITSVSAQCPEDGFWINLSFSSQSDIDAFINLYPNCTEVDEIIISGLNITDLSGLNNITTVFDRITIQGTSLTNLNGLENLSKIGYGNWDGEFEIINNDNLTNLSGLGGLTEINRELLIEANDNLVNLNGLGSLSTINRITLINNNSLTDLNGMINLTSLPYLTIENNQNLVDLSGLENINTVSECTLENNNLITLYGIANPINWRAVTIINENNITNLQGFENFTYLKFLDLVDNNNLEDLSGLQNLTSLQHLTLSENESLSDLSSLSNLTSLFVLNLEANNSLEDLSGLENLTSLSRLTLKENENLSDLSSLSNLTSLGDLTSFSLAYLKIVGNSSLEDLSGLENITFIQGISVALDDSYILIEDNNVLSDLSALDNITLVAGNISIINNDGLTTLDCLNSLTVHSNELIIKGNDNLLEIDGFSNITNIGNKLTIENNNSLVSIIGFSNMQFIWNISLIDNNQLTYIPGFSALSTITNNFAVKDNPMLSNCSLPVICNHIVNGGLADISGNLVGCNTADEIITNCNTILGRINHPIFYDVNQNGILEDGEPFYQSASVNIQPDNINSFGNLMNGGFTYKNFGNYTITYNSSVTPDWQLTTASSYDITLDEDNLSDTLLFGIFPDTMYSEMNATIAASVLRCNTYNKFNVYGANNGTTIIDEGTLWLESDMNVVGADYIDVPDTIVAPNLYGWHFNNLPPGARILKQINLSVPGPPNLPIGSSLEFQSYITYNVMSVNYTSNTFEYTDIVDCSYDPNDKLVNPCYPFNYALIGEPLTYTIRFQNTGNAEAFDVVVRDTLDPQLDPATFRLIASSHESVLSTELDENQNLTFSFIDINLPDSTSNFEASQGFVTYSIQANSSIEEGTEIQNTAGIYFDFNPPIITNTTENTMVYSFDVDEDGADIWSDCDDMNADVFPGNLEIAYNGFDDDCNPATLDDDLDQDGFNISEDCDDNDFSINPEAIEIADNEIDEDCDGVDLIISAVANLQLHQPKVFPNPTNGILNVNLQNRVEGFLYLKDYSGKQKLSQVLQQENQIDLSDFATGIYMLEVKTKNDVWIERVVKIH